jgi:hypothetical protein
VQLNKKNEKIINDFLNLILNKTYSKEYIERLISSRDYQLSLNVKISEPNGFSTITEMNLKSSEALIMEDLT